MPVAEVFLSAFITVLFEKLASGELLNFSRKEGIYFHLKKWSKTLSKIHAVLADAEEKQITDRAVKLWLEDLRDLAYDLDDVLDEVSTEILRLKAMAEFNSKKSKVQKLIPTCCTTVKFNHSLRSKLGEINSRLVEIAQQKSDLGLREYNGGRFNRMRERMPTTSLVDESRVYGREKDKQVILDLLLTDERNYDLEACVIPIVGMGGVGKTTLAQLVYNDAKIDNCFDLKIWVCVSEVFDVFGMTKLIFESVAPESREIRDLNMLQVSLREKLLKKKFLLVLDDVWNENYEKWDLLRGPLRAGLPGSRIVVTTRNEGVASVMSSAPPYRLKELAAGDCLSLLCQHALSSISFDARPDLRMVGESLVKKCKGLPLAAKTLGGLLRSKSSPKEWEDILNSKIWDLPEEKSDILPVLRLSYYHLPTDLKPLFSYCSVFPKDYEFDKDELILFWMGEGFLHQSEGTKKLEELGDEYFKELLSRSFFQHSSGNESRFTMHDLINDLAQFVAGEICLRLDEKSEGTAGTPISRKARHSSYIRRQYEILRRFRSLHAAQGLRTFLPLEVNKLEGWQKSYVSKGLLDSLPKLHSLRVLSLSGYCIAELPNSIGDLKHLRFLDLSETSIKQIPESVCSLYNLQTFLLYGCYRLTKLPAGLGNLINLRHLNNADTKQLQEMPTGIYKLTSLQTLGKMVLGNTNGSLKLRELRSLSDLHGTLAITELQSVTDPKDAREADLASKKGIDWLVMEYNKGFDDSRDAGLEKDVLELLQPHGNLVRLSILFYGGTEFPSWIGPGLLKSLTQLTLGGCRSLTLPALGQLPALAELYVHDMHRVKRVGTEFCGGDHSINLVFPALEVLRFENMPEWEEWGVSLSNEENAFPCLRELSICNCPELTAVSLPNFPVLHELNLDECNVQVLRSIFGISSVNVLKLRCVWGLSQLSEEFTLYLESLEDLDINECGDLISLWDGKSAKEHLSNLKNLGIYHCPQLKCLSLEEHALPRTLESLSICNCSNFEKFPHGFDNALSLRELRVIACPKIVSLGEGELSSLLKRVEIAWCENLETLPYGSHCLEELEIEGCPSLKSMSTDRLPSTLKVLKVHDCRELTSASDTLLQGSSGIERLRISNWPKFTMLLTVSTLFSCLVELHISRCDTLASFPQGCLPFRNLRSLSIWSCSNLKKVPDQIGQLTLLESLMLHDCPSLESFPEQELPPNLTMLWVSSCHGLQPLSEWGLYKLTALQKLTLNDGFADLVSFPDDCLLPSSLTSLWLARLCNLESLSEGFKNLSSLQHLVIRDCAKLRHLPNQELLDTMSYLEIRGSPLLKQRCLKEKGEYWLKIANIPCVYVDGTMLHEQNS